MFRKLTGTALALTAIVLPATAQAYIGPGMGAGAIAATLGVVAAVFMAFVALLWYPFKRMFGLGKKKPTGAQPEA